MIDAVGRSTDDTAYWHDWTKKYDYVYLLFTDEDSDNPMPDKLKTAYEGQTFQLYRILKPGMDPNAAATPKKPIHLNAAATAAQAGQPAPIVPPAAPAASPAAPAVPPKP